MKKLVLIACFVLSLGTLHAAFRVVPLPDGRYARLSDDGTEVWRGDYATGKEQLWHRFSELRMHPFSRGISLLPSPDGLRMLVQSDSLQYMVCRVETGRADSLSYLPEQRTPLFSLDGKKLAFVSHNDIYIKRLEYDTQVRVTNDSSSTIYNGIVSPEKRFAFGLGEHLMLWSADGMYLVYAKNEQLYMYSLQYKWNRPIVLPDEDAVYITCLQRTANPEQIAVLYLDKSQTKLRLAKVDLSTLLAKRIYEQVDERFIAPALVSFVEFIPGTGQILLLSDKSGHTHLQLHTASGQWQRALTEGEWDVTHVYGYDATAQRVFFQSSASGPTERVVMSVGLHKSAPQVLSEPQGWSEAVFSADYKFAELTYSRLHIPAYQAIWNTQGKQVRADSLPQVPMLQKQAYDFGGGLRGWILRSDEATKPLVMWCGDATDRYIADWTSRLAEQGYVVAAVYTHGHAGSGTDFEHAAYGHIYTLPAEDYAQAAQKLQAEGVSDGRNYIIGEGMGGGVVLTALQQANHPWRAGVAIAPVADLRLGNRMLLERFMRSEGYLTSFSANQPIKQAAAVKAPLLLLQAMNARQVPAEQSYRMVDALMKAGVPVDMQFYPYRDEAYTRWGAEEYVWQGILRFLQSNP